MPVLKQDSVKLFPLQRDEGEILCSAGGIHKNVPNCQPTDIGREVKEGLVFFCNVLGQLGVGEVQAVNFYVLNVLYTEDVEELVVTSSIIGDGGAFEDDVLDAELFDPGGTLDIEDLEMCVLCEIIDLPCVQAKGPVYSWRSNPDKVVVLAFAIINQVDVLEGNALDIATEFDQ